LERTRLRSFSMLVALVVAALLVSLLGLDAVALVGDTSDIPPGLPQPYLPLPMLDMELMVFAVAVGIIGLVQGAGISGSAGEGIDEAKVMARLSVLQGREVVFQRETSTFADAREYILKHALLREVTYENVLKQVRRAYHGLVADWLLEQAGERGEEYTGLIADHLELAERAAEAIDYLMQARDRARCRWSPKDYSRCRAICRPKSTYAGQQRMLRTVHSTSRWEKRSHIGVG
jgi:hypothetical protein